MQLIHQETKARKESRILMGEKKNDKLFFSKWHFSFEGMRFYFLSRYFVCQTLKFSPLLLKGLTLTATLILSVTILRLWWPQKFPMLMVPWRVLKNTTTLGMIPNAIHMIFYLLLGIPHHWLALEHNFT